MSGQVVSAAGQGAPEAPDAPCVELANLGIWYRRRRQTLVSLRRFVLGGAWRRPMNVLWALRHVDLVCNDGEVLGVVGRNGAGKSTLALVLAGILEPDEGSAVVRGRVNALLSLGAGFNWDLSGRANVLINAAFLGIPRREAEERMRDIVAFAELEEAIDEPVRTYSNGMRARLGFAIAAVIEPEILILDEVLSVGDIAFRRKSRQRIEEMMANSRLIILVSHMPSILRGLCTRCLWLERGRVVADGAADELLDAYEEAMIGKDVEP